MAVYALPAITSERSLRFVLMAFAKHSRRGAVGFRIGICLLSDQKSDDNVMRSAIMQLAKKGLVNVIMT